jgi:hypothetical protein
VSGAQLVHVVRRYPVVALFLLPVLLTLAQPSRSVYGSRMRSAQKLSPATRLQQPTFGWCGSSIPSVRRERLMASDRVNYAKGTSTRGTEQHGSGGPLMS